MLVQEKGMEDLLGAAPATDAQAEEGGGSDSHAPGLASSLR